MSIVEVTSFYNALPLFSVMIYRIFGLIIFPTRVMKVSSTIEKPRGYFDAGLSFEITCKLNNKVFPSAVKIGYVIKSFVLSYCEA
jgi:hypothetical protein